MSYLTARTKLSALALTALLLSGCSTIGSVTDAINPFDKTDAEKRAEQGDVAGENERISILELSDSLNVSDTVTPDQVSLPPAYVNTDWPQVGGNRSEEHTSELQSHV